MTQKNHRVIRGRRDLLNDPNVHADIFGRFDQKFVTKKGHRFIIRRYDLLYVYKDHGDLFGSFDDVYDRKSHWVIKGSCDLLYAPQTSR